jgi:hypothetical protein
MKYAKHEEAGIHAHHSPTGVLRKEDHRRQDDRYRQDERVSGAFVP